MMNPALQEPPPPRARRAHLPDQPGIDGTRELADVAAGAGQASRSPTPTRAAAREPPSFTAEVGGDVRPSQRGAVSVKRGGGAFEFTITPKTNPGLDKEELVCVGRVLDEDLPVLDALNAIPAKKDLVSLGDVPPLGSKIARACEYANPDATCAQFKPPASSCRA